MLDSQSNLADDMMVHMIDEIPQNNYVQNKTTMCDQTNCVDAEIQCDSILKGRVAVQTLAQRKPRKQKQKGRRSQKNCLTPFRTKELTVKPIKLFGQEVMQEPIHEQHRQDIVLTNLK